MSEDVVAFDLTRMLIGDTSLLFILEIAFRTVVIYVYTLALIRWIGGRSIGQLSLVEFLLVIALGSAVGDAMFYPEVPLIHCMAVITFVVLLDKGLSHLVSRHPRLEDAIEGKTVAIVSDGIIDYRQLLELNLGHDELFEQLRLKDIEHVGQVRAAYFETNGLISVFRTDDASSRPGLSIVPPWDVSEPKDFRAGTEVDGRHGFACVRCAALLRPRMPGVLPPCPNCEGHVFHALADRTDAITASAETPS